MEITIIFSEGGKKRDFGHIPDVYDTTAYEWRYILW